MKTPLAALQIGSNLSLKLIKSNNVSEIGTVLQEMSNATAMAVTFLDSLCVRCTVLVYFSLIYRTACCCSCTESSVVIKSVYRSAAMLDRGDTVLEPTQTTVSIPEVINSALGACKLWCTKAVTLTSNGESPMLAV